MEDKVANEDLEQVLANRLGDKKRAKELASAYLSGMTDYAVERTTGQGGVPTTLVGERVELLLNISRRLGHLITEREIAALLRVNPGTARRLHIELRSVHEDVVRPFVYQYALQGAETNGKGEHAGVQGTRVVFATEDQMTAFLSEAERTSVAVARKRDEANLPWLVYVDAGFDLSAYGLA
jgi:hypothetical protein